jgi:cation transport ATPase
LEEKQEEEEEGEEEEKKEEGEEEKRKKRRKEEEEEEEERRRRKKKKRRKKEEVIVVVVVVVVVMELVDSDRGPWPEGRPGNMSSVMARGAWGRWKLQSQGRQRRRGLERPGVWLPVFPKHLQLSSGFTHL